jgi:serine/alanine adding enzyme
MLLFRNENISQANWATLLAISPYRSPFQTPIFYELCKGIHGISVEAFALEEDNQIKALCVVTVQKEHGIYGYFSRRAIIYGGPILWNIDDNALEFFLSCLSNEFKRKSIYLEIRNLNNYDSFKNVFLRNGFEYMPYQNFTVDCSDKEKLFNKLGNNRKRQINKALKSGILIKEAETLKEVNGFYYILKNLYDQKIKKPLLPKEFFEAIFNKCFGKYFLVMYKDKIIGGILCPILEGKCIYEFYVCGLDEEYKEQFPSTMATWTAMEYANRNNIPVFDFMGAGRNDKDYGVREYKSRFGGELVEYGRFIKINNQILYKIGVLALSLMRIMKK